MFSSSGGLRRAGGLGEPVGEVTGDSAGDSAGEDSVEDAAEDTTELAEDEGVEEAGEDALEPAAADAAEALAGESMPLAVEKMAKVGGERSALSGTMGGGAMAPSSRCDTVTFARLVRVPPPPPRLPARDRCLGLPCGVDAGEPRTAPA